MKYLFLLFPFWIQAQTFTPEMDMKREPDYKLIQPVFRDNREYFWYYSADIEHAEMSIFESSYRYQWIKGEPVTIYREYPITKDECPDCIFVTFAPLWAVKYTKEK